MEITNALDAKKAAIEYLLDEGEILDFRPLDFRHIQLKSGLWVVQATTSFHAGKMLFNLEINSQDGKVIKFDKKEL
ncbi:hypothetical protein BMS3Abin16_00067 [archaeon BMS3Abin16]|nr:hypothetical protein BMS3Abin16_00067 [archaeon BMS3Abin16]